MNVRMISLSRRPSASATSASRELRLAARSGRPAPRHGRSPRPEEPQTPVNCSGWKVWKPSSSDTVRAWICGRTATPSAWAARRQVELTAPRVGVVVVLGQRERDRAADGGRQAPHPLHLPLRRGEVLAERRRPGPARTRRCRARRAPDRCRTARPRPRTCRARARRRWRGGRACGRWRSRGRRPRCPLARWRPSPRCPAGVAGSLRAPRSPIT